MSIIHTISKGMAWNSLAMAIGKVVGFANLLIILAHLTVYEYGLTELSLAVVPLFGLFLLPGLSSIVTIDLGVEKARKNYSAMRRLFKEYVVLIFALGVVAWAILFFGSSLIAHWSGNDLIDRFLKVVSFLFLTSPFRTITTMLSTVMVRYADQSFFSVIEDVSKGVFLLLFFFVFEQGAYGLLWAIVLAQVVTVLAFAPRTISAYRTFSSAPLSEHRPWWSILRGHRKWGIASSYIGMSGTSIRLFFLKFLLGTEAVGLYSFAAGFFSQLVGLLPIGPVVGPLIPRYVSQPEQLVRLLRSSIRLQLAVAVLLMGAGYALGPLVVHMWFAKYEAALPLLFIFLPALLPQGVVAIFTPVFFALKEQRSQLYSSVFKFGVDVVSLPILIYAFGFLGAGIHGIVVPVLSLSERYFRLKRLLPSFSFRFSDLVRIDPLEREFFTALISRIWWFRSPRI